MNHIAHRLLEVQEAPPPESTHQTCHTSTYIQIVSQLLKRILYNVYWMVSFSVCPCNNHVAMGSLAKQWDNIRYTHERNTETKNSGSQKFTTVFAPTIFPTT